MVSQDIIGNTSIMLSFSVLPDPRKVRNQTYSLYDIVTISILGVLCGADDWVEVVLWADSNQEWLKQFDIGINGIPSHDTFSRFFRFVDPLEFERCFLSWTQSISSSLEGVIALDGKTICGSKDGDKKAIHIVSAFSAQNNLVLGQLATEEKSNEITAFPILIDMLNLKKSIVTIDAAGCQKKITEQIRKKEGDYVLALKQNQRNLFEEVENFFLQALVLVPEESNCDCYITEEKSRGRFEKREVWVTSNLSWLPYVNEWKDLKSIACMKSIRKVKEKETSELRFYISSLDPDAEKIGKAIRSHWSIENKLHWQLDVSYREDECKIRKDNGAENFSVIRRATLNLLKLDKKTKAGIKNKRSKAGWNKGYMLEIIQGKC